MLAKLIITVLTVLLGVSQVSCANAKEQSEEVVIEKKNPVKKHLEKHEIKKEKYKMRLLPREKAIEEVVMKPVEQPLEQPLEYALPQHILDILQNNQVSYNVWKGRIEAIEKVIELEKSKIAIAQAHQGTDSSSIVHILRTYLASVGVAYDDLVNWKPEGNKAVRKTPVKEEK